MIGRGRYDAAYDLGEFCTSLYFFSPIEGKITQGNRHNLITVGSIQNLYVFSLCFNHELYLLI